MSQLRICLESNTLHHHSKRSTLHAQLPSPCRLKHSTTSQLRTCLALELAGSRSSYGWRRGKQKTYILCTHGHTAELQC